MKIGINLISPFVNMITTIAVTKEITAIVQCVFAISTATGANDKPIIIITGPTTIGGNRRSTNLSPQIFITIETIP